MPEKQVRELRATQIARIGSSRRRAITAASRARCQPLGIIAAPLVSYRCSRAADADEHSIRSPLCRDGRRPSPERDDDRDHV